MRWFLISDDDVNEIRQALRAPTHDGNDYNCQEWPPGQGCTGCAGDELREKAVHTLDLGLHITEAIPTDFACCVLCNEPFGNSLRYLLKSGEGWAHWHCIMNQKEKAV